ncbi:MAG: hypothetical protein MJ196_04710 [Treponemataceae bacterium]|nr:hypothetical protein [Treponemataceae bacterium]
MNRKLTKATEILSLVFEFFFLAVAAAYFIATILHFAKPATVQNWVTAMASETNNELKSAGFCVQVIRNGEYLRPGVLAILISGILANLCYTMIFRNVNLILRTMKGKTWFAKGETPFQKDITRMVREIGIFLILIPVVQTIISAIFRPVIGMEIAEMSVDMSKIITGIVVLALSEIFAYGENLEKDVEGLV